VSYLRNCVIQDPTDFGSPQGDVYVYQVGNLRNEMAAWNRPEDVTVRCRLLLMSIPPCSCNSSHRHDANRVEGLLIH
jgi:hypothetical protein